MTITMIAFLIALVAGLFFYVLLIPRNTSVYSPEISEDNKKLRLLAALSDEFNSALPSGVGPMQNQKEYPKIASLIRRAGNPWNLTPQEFVFMQWTFALLGFLVAWPVWGIIKAYAPFTIPWFIIIPIFAVLFYFYPRSIYSDQAKRRDLEFKRQLPEALDLMIISLSAGTTFSQALRDSIPNMPAGVLKEEFLQIDKNIKAGKTLDEALTIFGERAPNDAISAFVKSVKEATRLDVPIIEILEARAAASRQEFYALVHTRTAKLESKMMLSLAPTLVPALILVLISPSLVSLLNALGS